jgi:hypothetical protein
MGVEQVFTGLFPTLRKYDLVGKTIIEKKGKVPE